MFAAINGCGNGGGDTAVTPTPTPTGYNVALTASVSSLQAGQGSILTATVTNGSGEPVSGLAVIFSLLVDSSGATLVPVGTGKTDASGKTIAIYTAGATDTSTVEDIIQASAGGSTDIVTITRSVATVASLSLTADATSLAAGQQTIITATVMNNLGNPASGVTVGFSIDINRSGATITPIGGGVTDASGRATATYTAGSVNPDYKETDYVYARCAPYEMQHITIIRTAATAPLPVGYRMTVTATPVSLAADAISVIVATVTNNATGTGASGVAVEFDLLIDNSGATLTPVNLTTDTSGTAIATYTAGNNTPSLSIQDVVTASVTGSAGAVIITRLPNAGTGNRILSFTEDPETTPDLPIGPTYSNVIMKVKVTTDDLTSPPAEVVTVTFSILAGGTGTLSSTTATTDTMGEAFVTFTRPTTGSGDTVVRAQIPGTINGGDAARIVYWTDVTP